MKPVPLALAMAVLSAPFAAGAAAPSPFDSPLKIARVPLPKDPDNPPAKPKVTCAYYPRFMVKEVDLGEIGAAQLSVLPIPDRAAKTPCRRDNSAGELVVSPDDWTGYFDGVKGDYVVFTAEDGWNGGLGFAVISARSGKKLFDDALLGQFRLVAAGPNGLTLRYRRVYAAKCSLRADAAGCWRQIVRDTGLSGPAPDCNAAYAREARRTPKFARQVRDDPTVVDYDAEALVGAGTKTIKPLSGKAPDCRPAD
jgi:hypothetical protein